MFHDCPECCKKLVPSYGFKTTGLLNKIAMIILCFAVALCAISSYIWGFDPVGKLVFVVPACASGIVHTFYWASLRGVDKEILETRLVSEESA